MSNGWVTEIVRKGLERSIVSNCNRLVALMGNPQKITVQLGNGRITIEMDNA
jgi:hypothetical protein